MSASLAHMLMFSTAIGLCCVPCKSIHFVDRGLPAILLIIIDAGQGADENVM